MILRRSAPLSIALLMLLDVSSAPAQVVQDRVVGLTEFEEPLIITKVDGQTLGILAKAAGVPIGFEGFVGDVRLEDVTVSKAIGVLTSRLGAPEHARNSFPDTRTFSVDLPQASVLDVLNGVARAHGELCWEWEELTPSDRTFSGGQRFSVLFGVLGGGGLGFAIP